MILQEFLFYMAGNQNQTSCENADSDLQEPLNAVIVRNFTDNSGAMFGRYYECPPGMMWDTGEGPGRLSQCQFDQWNVINDSCVVGKFDCGR